jgi:ribosome maturation factor RimP
MVEKERREMASPLFAILESTNYTLEVGSPGEIRTLAGGSKARYAFFKIESF